MYVLLLAYEDVVARRETNKKSSSMWRQKFCWNAKAEIRNLRLTIRLKRPLIQLFSIEWQGCLIKHVEVIPGNNFANQFIIIIY